MGREGSLGQHEQLRSVQYPGARGHIAVRPRPKWRPLLPRRFLRGDTWKPWERHLLGESAMPEHELAAPRTLVLVTWLHHISANLAKAERYRRARVWRAANVDRVLELV